MKIAYLMKELKTTTNTVKLTNARTSRSFFQMGGALIVQVTQDLKKKVKNVNTINVMTDKLYN